MTRPPIGIDVAALSPSSAMRKGATYKGSKNRSKTIRQPNEAHQYWPHFWLHAEGDYAGVPYQSNSATRTSDSPTNNEGRFIRCNITYQTADSEDQDGNDEGGS